MSERKNHGKVRQIKTKKVQIRGKNIYIYTVRMGKNGPKREKIAIRIGRKYGPNREKKYGPDKGKKKNLSEVQTGGKNIHGPNKKRKMQRSKWGRKKITIIKIKGPNRRKTGTDVKPAHSAEGAPAAAGGVAMASRLSSSSSSSSCRPLCAAPGAAAAQRSMAAGPGRAVRGARPRGAAASLPPGARLRRH